MTSYTSLNSYVLALRLRSAKTILVEGKHDKKVLSRILLEHAVSDITPAVVIDEASIINDKDNMCGFGNKQKVIAAGSRATGIASFTFLADREWDGWVLSPSVQERPVACEGNGHFTKGHSIENYWFSGGALIEYLKNSYPEHLRASYFSELNNRFEKILRFSAAYSLAAKDANLITKSSGLLKLSHLSWVGSEYKLNSLILNCLKSRGENLDILSSFNEKYELVKEVDTQSLQWLSHGHLGEEAIRCCAASLVMELTPEPTVASAIERGSKSEKLNFDASYIAKLPIDVIEPIGKIVKWANTNSKETQQTD